MNAASSATYTTDYEPTEEELAELVAQLDRLVEGVYPHVSDGPRERTLVEKSSRPVDRFLPLITRRLPDPAGWVVR